MKATEEAAEKATNKPAATECTQNHTRKNGKQRNNHNNCGSKQCTCGGQHTAAANTAVQHPQETVASLKELHEQCTKCAQHIEKAKSKQAAEADRVADALLEELQKEQTQLESRKAAKERKKEKRKAKKKALKGDDEKESDEKTAQQLSDTEQPPEEPKSASIVSAPIVQPESDESDDDEKPPTPPTQPSRVKVAARAVSARVGVQSDRVPPPPDDPPTAVLRHRAPANVMPIVVQSKEQVFKDQRIAKREKLRRPLGRDSGTAASLRTTSFQRGVDSDWEQAAQKSGRNKSRIIVVPSATATKKSSAAGTPVAVTAHPDDPYNSGWKEVRSSSTQPTGGRRQQYKMIVGAQYVARVIGRGGHNINTIREVTHTQIEIEKQPVPAGRDKVDARYVAIRGGVDGIRLAQAMIQQLIDDQDAYVEDVVKKVVVGHLIVMNSAQVVDADDRRQAKQNAALASAAAGVPAVTSTQPAAKPAAPVIIAKSINDKPPAVALPASTTNVWVQRAQRMNTGKGGAMHGLYKCARLQ